MQQLLTAAQLSWMVYQSNELATCEALALDFDSVKHFGGDSGTHCMLAIRGDEAWIAFRGTEWCDVVDLIRNVQFWPVSSPIELSSRSRVFRGFLLSAQDFYQQIRHAVIHIDRVFVTGHSQGAAVAGIVATMLGFARNLIGLSRPVFIGFGCPKFGTKAFNQSLVQYTDATLVTHRSDPVPWLPLWPYCTAPATRIHFTSDGVLSPYTTRGYFHDQWRGMLRFSANVATRVLKTRKILRSVVSTIEENGSHLMSFYLASCSELSTEGKPA